MAFPAKSLPVDSQSQQKYRHQNWEKEDFNSIFVKRPWWRIHEGDCEWPLYELGNHGAPLTLACPEGQWRELTQVWRELAERSAPISC